MNAGECQIEPAAVTIGVAGHTNHGKSTLIRCLSDTETVCRAPAEQQRGLSLGCPVVPIKNAVGQTAAMIEVPGHREYLQHAIRGLCAVDMVVLVVAADDGVTPQTSALLNLSQWLGIRRGMVVLSKTDLVDEDLRGLAEKEIREAVAGSSLHGCRIVPFSSINRTGIDEIRRSLDETARTITARPMHSPFRMWIDQARSFTGIGTVACGTILSGRVRADDPLVLLPTMKETKARSLEVHHQRVTKAVAGQRIGINLPRVDLSDVQWGMALGSPDTLKPGRFFNVVVQATEPLLDQQPVDLYVGTVATQAALVLMQKEALFPGESGLAQLRVPEAIAAATGDRFILGLINKPAILGSGTILEISDQKHQASNAAGTISYLTALRSNQISDIIRACLRRYPGQALRKNEIAHMTGLSIETIQQELNALVQQTIIIKIREGYCCLQEDYETCAANLIKTIKSRISRHPLFPYINKEEIRKSLDPPLSDVLFCHLLDALTANRRIHNQGPDYTIPDFSCALSDAQRKIIRRLLAFAEKNGDCPFSLGNFLHVMPRDMKKYEVQQIANYLCLQGELIRIQTDHYLLPGSLETIKQRIIKAFESCRTIHLAASKEILGYGRSKGTLVFEYLDEIGFTVRQGDLRTLSTPPCVQTPT